MDEIIEPTGTVEDAIRELLSDNDEAAREYLKESFLAEAVLALFHARRDAGFTQAQLATRLGTKQSSIARLERDLSGSMTLRRYVEVALACGIMPLDITLVPIEQIKQYVIHDPSAIKTPAAFNAWVASQEPVSLSPVPSLQPDVLNNANEVLAVPVAPVPYTVKEATELDAHAVVQQPLWSANSTGIRTGRVAA